MKNSDNNIALFTYQSIEIRPSRILEPNGDLMWPNPGLIQRTFNGALVPGSDDLTKGL